MLRPIERKSLSDSVFEQLRDEIVSGRMEPGEPLPSERALCELLGVNRGALREAIKRLEQARLVRVQHGGATRVLDFLEHGEMGLLATLLITPEGTVRAKVARGVVEMRSALAPDIGRLAALRGGAEAADRLDAVVAAMVAAGDDLVAVQEDALRFWEVLVEASDNVAYRLAFNSLSDGYRRFMELMTELLAAELRHLDGYRAIAGAVRAGDGEGARALCATQIGLGADAMSAMIDRLVTLQAAEASP